MDQRSTSIIWFQTTGAEHQEHSKETCVYKHFLGKPPEEWAIKVKQIGLPQAKKLLHCKENYQ